MFEKLYKLPLFVRFVHVWEKYERFFTGGALLLGFYFDLLVATRPDSLANNLLLLTYLLAAGGLIIALNLRKTMRMEEENPAEPMLLLLALQFLFGNLSSNLLVLYGRSGTIAGSSIFIGILLAMLIGNEFLKTRYGQLRFNIAIYYTLVFSYLMIAVPTFILHDIGMWVFLASGVASLLFIAAFLWVVYAIIFKGKYRKRHLFEVSLNVAAIFFAFNVLYFLNIIPPVPLALKDIGVYHSVSRVSSGVYTLSYEKPWWFAFWRSTSPTYHIALGNPAYCFSSVFAPTGLSTPVVHTWERYNEKTKEWQILSRFSFAINGGRDGGYRGFSTKTLTEGKWRCDVETENGQLIGRMSFKATLDSTVPELTSKTL
ncbi:MAG: DUF2914 domain-containing protein [Patescibacteria group bacterium]